MQHLEGSGTPVLYTRTHGAKRLIKMRLIATLFKFISLLIFCCTNWSCSFLNNFYNKEESTKLLKVRKKDVSNYLEWIFLSRNAVSQFYLNI
jgi:hypothetical protein